MLFVHQDFGVQVQVKYLKTLSRNRLDKGIKPPSTEVAYLILDKDNMVFLFFFY